MRIGILGAGQLGRMLALAGYPLGLQFSLLDPAPGACGAELGQNLQAAFDDHAALDELLHQCDVVTYEFENVPLSAARHVAASGRLFPGPAALEAAQDRLSEKQLFEKLDIALPRYMPVASREALSFAAGLLGVPCVLKTRRMGYDGKGQFVIRAEDQLDAAWAHVGGKPCVLEAFVPFQRELSCIGVRGRDGETRCYPLIENQHRNGILHLSIPTRDEPLQAEAEAAWTRVATHLDYVGVLAFEFFVSEGRLLANEIAPRVHNSGHWSIEGAECSQFENHLRAVAGLPLGSTALRGHSAMLNLIGQMPDTRPLLQTAGVHLHDYGKSPKPGRKLGHVTLLAGDAGQLQKRVSWAQSLINPAS